ncbi:MAG: hypothetical protein ABWZ82_01215 [Candidatus Limnocylindrales bacterium]
MARGKATLDGMWSLDHPPERPPVCSVCGIALTGDPDDDPWHPTGPVCGDCVRSRADDELMWALGATDQGEDIW